MSTDPKKELDFDPAEARLDEYAGDVMMKKSRFLGFPINQKSQLVGFYKWLYGSGFNLSMINNAGDPFNHGDEILNTLDFEREVIEYFAPLYGFDPGDTWGIVTFSGTDGNNHGIYFGANYLKKKTQKNPILYVSEEAHYSSKRLADLQNLELRIIPADVKGCMITEEFEKALVPDKPALMVYAMGTTFKGGIDDQAALNAILAKHPEISVYRHLDAALFGGYIPFTEYRDIINRKIQPFDSIAISGHKFFGMDEPAGMFITSMDVKQNQNPYEISYLNASMPMINCSRSALSPLKFWWIINHTTKEEFSAQAEGMLKRARWLKDQFDKIGWPAWLAPMSNTVYFKRPPEEIAANFHLSPDFDERRGGALSHIVVMQHVSEEKLGKFLDVLKTIRK
ncbi:pyridoxal-dependent decarboxylase [Oribacterium sp. WCC10]|uniref:pyridoxal-dependent decarboxylase n=1 Tax=Oribacterium sp. WCC10 TaxID=1855343 RepID=UPI0008EB66F8|nr:pyridoxal-dependent decarboxylase [Oribacterium sp. WCC10]SFG67822.1 histidine decarboxylase [Oribacterium sp. WCC10]